MKIYREHEGRMIELKYDDRQEGKHEEWVKHADVKQEIDDLYLMLRDKNHITDILCDMQEKVMDIIKVKDKANKE